MSWYRSVWLNKTGDSTNPIPESISAISSNNLAVLHNYRGTFTSLMLHEILHSFGMSDGEGARENVFYKGIIYDGSQELFSKDIGSDIRDVDAETGIFQAIGKNVSEQIGWSDRNMNGKIDVEELCQSSSN
jgi:hypothetical protein